MGDDYVITCWFVPQFQPGWRYMLKKYRERKRGEREKEVKGRKIAEVIIALICSSLIVTFALSSLFFVLLKSGVKSKVVKGRGKERKHVTQAVSSSHFFLASIRSRHVLSSLTTFFLSVFLPFFLSFSLSFCLSPFLSVFLPFLH